MEAQKIVLLIEDNEDDERLTRRVLQRNNVTNELVVAYDGEQALDVLFQRGEYSGGFRGRQPSLVVLDLHIPKRSGVEVLKAIRSEARTALIPVVVLTADESPNTIAECYQAGANSFVVKPKSAEEFSESILNMAMFWLLLNQTAQFDPVR